MERKNIDYYIEKANNMKPTDQSPRAGSEGYRIDDVILLKYGIYRKDESLQMAINDAVERGAQTPRYLEVKEDKDNYWVLQEIAKGRNGFSNEEVGKYFTNLIKAPDEQYKNLLITMKELFDFGFEIRTTNIFYDEEAGFTVIDIDRPPEKSFDEKNISDINEIISNADTAISTLYYFASWMGERMSPENQFEREFITYRLLSIAKDVVPSINMQKLTKYYHKYWENKDIFEEFETKIKKIDEITLETLEDVIHSMFEKNPEIKERVRN